MKNVDYTKERERFIKISDELSWTHRMFLNLVNIFWLQEEL